VEWRIPFRDILLMEADAPEVLRVFGLAGLTQAERLSEKMLPPLELYFPVAEHRIGWRAEAPIQVAVRIGRGDTYTLYQTDGSTSLTRGSYLPTTATLVLAPSEIDYTDRASALRGGTRTGPGMEAASTVLLSKVGATALPPEPEQPPPPPPTGGVSTNRHTHLSYFKTTRYHDVWLGGHDEVEIFGSVNGSYKACTWRTDVQPNRDYYLPLDNPFWDIATAVPWGTALAYIEAFEDDDGRCVRRPSDDRYGSTFLKIENYGIIVGTSNPGDIALQVSSVP